jgi:ArsR family transcriptional regulator
VAISNITDIAYLGGVKYMEYNLWIYELQAQFCKAMAHPKRLMILDILKNEGEMTVTELAKATNIPQSNLSQHLTFLKNQGIVKIRKEGSNTHYSIANPKVVDACNIIKGIIVERIRKTQLLLNETDNP